MRIHILGFLAFAAALATLSPAQATPRWADGKCPLKSDAQLKVLGAKGEYEGVMVEYIWLDINRPGWTRTEQAHITVGRKDYDLLYISKGRKKQVICFDITDFFGKGS